jgi:hypothetical protein
MIRAGKLICNFICSASPHTQMQLHMFTTRVRAAWRPALPPRSHPQVGTRSNVQVSKRATPKSAHGA